MEGRTPVGADQDRIALAEIPCGRVSASGAADWPTWTSCCAVVRLGERRFLGYRPGPTDPHRRGKSTRFRSAVPGAIRFRCPPRFDFATLVGGVSTRRNRVASPQGRAAGCGGSPHSLRCTLLLEILTGSDKLMTRGVSLRGRTPLAA